MFYSERHKQLLLCRAQRAIAYSSTAFSPLPKSVWLLITIMARLFWQWRVQSEFTFRVASSSPSFTFHSAQKRGCRTHSPDARARKRLGDAASSTASPSIRRCKLKLIMQLFPQKGPLIAWFILRITFAQGQVTSDLLFAFALSFLFRSLGRCERRSIFLCVTMQLAWPKGSKWQTPVAHLFLPAGPFHWYLSGAKLFGTDIVSSVSVLAWEVKGRWEAFKSSATALTWWLEMLFTRRTGAGEKERKRGEREKERRKREREKKGPAKAASKESWKESQSERTEREWPK